MILLLLACSSGSPETSETVTPDGSAPPAEEMATRTPSLPDISQTPVTATMSAEEVVHTIEIALSPPPDPGPTRCGVALV